MAERNARIDAEVRRLSRILAEWRGRAWPETQRPVIEAGTLAIQARLRDLGRARRAA